MNPRNALCLVVLLSAWSATGQAASSFDGCSGTIAALPAVISTQGTWCFEGDRSTLLATGAAIKVNTNNVTIDCNGFKLTGTGAGEGTATIGIQAVGRVNVTVRDCHIRGFRVAVQGGGSAFRILGNRLESSTQRALSISGDHHTIRGNLITDTGGSTLGDGAALGVVLSGSGDILDNTIGGVVARSGGGGGAWGIQVSDDDGPALANIVGNRIRDVIPDGPVSVGIRNVSSGPVTIADNVMFGTGAGIGISCANAKGAVRGNSVMRFATGLSGCPSDGGNVVRN